MFRPALCVKGTAMRVTLSNASEALLGIVGHAGCGHAHSNNGFIQDDSGGLATVLALFQEATNLDLTIAAVRATTGLEGRIEVETRSGGVGSCTVRRGLTLQEARLAQHVVGQNAVRTQALALDAFGRIYGQGALEAPVALQTAIANAALDSFARRLPQQFVFGWEDLPGNCGRLAGTMLDIDGVPVATLGVVNATEGGLGPVEELEGNAWLYGKKPVMDALNMRDLPTLVIEGKIFSRPMSDNISEDHFLVRAFADDDNVVVAEAFMQGLDTLKYPALYPREALRRTPGGLERLTREAGATICAFGERLQASRTSAEKVAVLAELIAFASQDAGGISFMSDALHNIVGGPGLMPGTAAVLSLIISADSLKEVVMPWLTENDVARYVAVVKATVPQLAARIDEARARVATRKHIGTMEHFTLEKPA